MIDSGVSFHLFSILMMSTSIPEFTPAEWDQMIDRFLASGQTQAAFCQGEGMSRFRFAYHYRRSEKFIAKRKASPDLKKTKKRQKSGFRTVHKKPATATDSLGGQNVSIHIGEDVRLHCPADVGVEAVVRLIRETRS